MPLSNEYSQPFPSWVPEPVVDFYASMGIKKLFKWQHELIDIGMKDSANLVFTAPTSGGKSLVAEILALHACKTEGKRVLFVLPYISVAREKLHIVQRCWRRIDISVSAFIGPQASNPREWRAAVCTIEKAASLINRSLLEEWFEEIGMIVIDELHMVMDGSRGNHIEYMLSKILYHNKTKSAEDVIRVIGMSATIPGLKNIGKWLNAIVYKTNFRPIDINENMVIGNTIYEMDGETVKGILENDTDPIIKLAEKSFLNSSPTLIMCSSKLDSEKIAVSIAKHLSVQKNSNKLIISTLEGRMTGLINIKNVLEKNCGCKDKHLLSTLAYSVGFHHAGLTLEEREIIENGFREKSILIIVATSTLASGVNLPAECVIVKAQTRGNSALTLMSYKQMIGRAGRMGHASTGESYLVVRESDEQRVRDILEDHDRKENGGKNGDAAKLVLEAICTGLAHDEEQLEGVGCLMLSEMDIHQGVERLLNNAFIYRDPMGQLHATQLGNATLCSSLPPHAALTIFDDLCHATKALALDTELHMLYLVTPINVSVWQECDWHHLFDIYSRLSVKEQRVGKLVCVSEQFLLERMNGRHADTVKLQVHIRFFSSLALFELINEVPIAQVSMKYRISRGCLQTLQTQSSTYAAMIVAFCTRLGWNYLQSLLEGFATRLFFGIRSDLSELVSIEGIDAHRARQLHSLGIQSVSQLCACETSKLAHYLQLSTPYTISGNEDGRREWLFGEPNMFLDEAAQILKKRAHGMMRQRIRELGVEIPDDFDIEKEHVESPIDAVKETSMEIFTKSLSEMSLIEEPCEADETLQELSTAIEVELDDEGDENIDSLEKSLLQVKTTAGMNVVDEDYEDSFDLPVRGAVPVGSVNRRHSILNESECSFDVFATPPGKSSPRTNQKLKLMHPRIGALSPLVSSPIVKSAKNDANLIQNDILEDVDEWKKWLKMVSKSSDIGLSVQANFIGISASNAPSICMNMDDKVVSVISLEERLSALRSILPSTSKKCYLYSINHCYYLYERYGITISDPHSVNILAFHAGAIDYFDCDDEENEIIPSLMETYNIGCDMLKKNLKNTERCAIYASVMKRLFEMMEELTMKQCSEMFVGMELKSSKSVVRMFYSGIEFNAKQCEEYLKILRSHCEKLEEECWQLANGKFNLDASKQVAYILFNRLRLVYPQYCAQTSRSKVHLSTSKQILEQISNQHPIVNKILSFRHISHTISNCLIPMKKTGETGRIRCHFDVITSTGRILTVTPNVQSVPKNASLENVECRRLFCAKTGSILICSDYCQLELRVLAHLSNDENIIEMIRTEEDIFKTLAVRWGFERDAVKQLCYGLIYGMGVRSLAENVRLKFEDAEMLYRSFFNMFPGVKSYIDQTISEAFSMGYAETLLGRRRVTNRRFMDAEEKSREERVIVNYTIQGTASEIFKNALIGVDEKLKRIDARIVMSVHDEIIIECEEKSGPMVAQLVKNCMEESLKEMLRVPMKVKIRMGCNWSDMKLI